MYTPRLARGQRAKRNQYWVERNKFDRVIRFPQGYHDLRAADRLAQTKIGQYSGYLPALEAAWRVGNTVVAKLLEDWKEYREHVPGGKLPEMR